MLFHIFFVTVNISKRKYTGKEIQREELRNNCKRVRQEMRAKQTQYIRVI